MTATDARTQTDDQSGGAPSTGSPLRPGRRGTDRLATGSNVARGRELRNVTSPLNGQVVGQGRISTAEDVTAAVAEARRVHERWAGTTLK